MGSAVEVHSIVVHPECDHSDGVMTGESAVDEQAIIFGGESGIEQEGVPACHHHRMRDRQFVGLYFPANLEGGQLGARVEPACGSGEHHLRAVHAHRQGVPAGDELQPFGMVPTIPLNVRMAPCLSALPTSMQAPNRFLEMLLKP